MSKLEPKISQEEFDKRVEEKFMRKKYKLVEFNNEKVSIEIRKIAERVEE